MSFQHFRLSEAVVPHPQQHMHTAPPVTVPPANVVQQYQAANTNNTFPTNHVPVGQATTTKAPYGSGDTDDGYTLVFPTIDAFHEWRQKEEDAQMVEFVKGDTHRSKAVPPRFKDHTKLVCARHSRSGRKKYVKKHPDRVRKVPSRKVGENPLPKIPNYKSVFSLTGKGAGHQSVLRHITIQKRFALAANFPFTRRGRKAAAEQEKQKPRKQAKTTHPSTAGGSNQTAGPSSSNAPAPQSKEHYSNAISMLAPLPATYQPVDNDHPPVPYFTQPAVAAASLSHGRWENMATLFESVRGQARTFDYPSASVAALEAVLVRLYLESPPSLPHGHIAPTATHDPNIQPNLGESSSASGQGSADDDG
ncbi:hypothetical protein R3P38DRAFT_2821998 [Favolaschia claudopus]|uniref:Uncharacterized protein n=1 Tax=Favolaschia claudopus TaxID=2862362 RepID=A0AAW0EHH9_9AGAR